MLEFFFGIFFTFKYSTRSIETVSCDAFLQKKDACARATYSQCNRVSDDAIEQP